MSLNKNDIIEQIENIIDNTNNIGRGNRDIAKEIYHFLEDKILDKYLTIEAHTHKESETDFHIDIHIPVNGAIINIPKRAIIRGYK